MSFRESKTLVETKGRVLRQQVAQLKANRKQISQELEIARLANRTEQLHLTLTALCRYLTEKGLIDESKLETLIKSIDQEDGDEDNKRPFKKTNRPSLLTPDPR